MNGWIWTLVVLLLLDAALLPTVVGKVRTPGEMVMSGVLSLLIVWAILHLGGVL